MMGLTMLGILKIGPLMFFFGFCLQQIHCLWRNGGPTTGRAMRKKGRSWAVQVAFKATFGLVSLLLWSSFLNIF